MDDQVSPVAELLGQAIYQFTVIKPMLPTYGHLLVSALFPIYTGAHASLSRPLSAAKPPKKTKKKDGNETEEEDEDEDEEGSGPMPKMEGLEPSDALMFPLMAGLTLGGLYLVIKWLGDPTTLNNILSFYFSQMGLFFAIAFLKDSMSVLRSFIFPRQYRRGGKIWKTDQSERVFTAVDNEQTRHSPLPGILGSLPLPGFIIALLWTSRNALYQRVKIRALMRGLFDAECRLGLLDLFSGIVGLSAVSYFAFVTKPWWLTNFLGFSFCYGALQFMSPSTFVTGSLILSSLFFYDIYFVFYTPLMVTVATKLDIPIKLLFPRPPTPGEAPDTTSLAMLGLGDIVVPGMMVGLALRFDLFLYYKRKGAQKAQAEGKDEPSVLPKYQTAAGGWGERFWTGSVKPKEPELEPPYHDAGAFPKTYFKAAVAGYISGMVTTLLAMQYFKHAQPALLYLVPGVLTFLWGTALIRGEVREMYAFSDAEEEEEDENEKDEDKKEKEAKGDGNQKEQKSGKSLFLRLLSGDIKALNQSDDAEKEQKQEKEDESASDNKTSSKGRKGQGKRAKNGTDKKDKDDNDAKDLDLFVFSIFIPRKSKSKSKSKTQREPKRSQSPSPEHGEPVHKDEAGSTSALAPVSEQQDNEPPVKRVRRSPRTVITPGDS